MANRVNQEDSAGDAMIEIRRILCPIDFSDYSRRALDHAIAIARWYESTITVLHVFSIAPAAVYAPGPAGFEAIVLTSVDREQLLADVARFAGAESASPNGVQPVVREGNVATEILKHAADMNADLLVMGTHGRSGFERLVLGSITEKVLRRARCPVLTVPRHHPDAVPAARGLFTRMLCPIDFSDCSMHALHYALSLAQEADAHLTVLHVMAYALEDTPDMYDTMITDERLSLADYRRRREDEARQRMNDSLPKTVGEYCSVETMIVRGKPSRAILRTAGERESDLIVIGVQGRGAADLMFFGSTTHHVVREATCPVLTLCREQPSA